MSFVTRSQGGDEAVRFKAPHCSQGSLAYLHSCMEMETFLILIKWVVLNGLSWGADAIIPLLVKVILVVGLWRLIKRKPAVPPRGSSRRSHKVRHRRRPKKASASLLFCSDFCFLCNNGQQFWEGKMTTAVSGEARPAPSEHKPA